MYAEFCDDDEKARKSNIQLMIKILRRVHFDLKSLNSKKMFNTHPPAK